MLQQADVKPAKAKKAPALPKNFDRKIHDTARRTLQRLIKKAEKSDRPVVEWLEIAPEFASLLLARNPDNRQLSEYSVGIIAKDMMAGRWVPFTGETIIVAKDGHLNDGQHRLQAIVDSGMSYPFLVVFGVERRTRVNLDLGRGRKAADFIAMNKIADGALIAAVATLLIGHEENAFDTSYNSKSILAKNKRASRTKQFQYAMEHLEAIKRSLTVIRRGYHSKNNCASQSRLAATHRILLREGADEASVDQFFHELNTGKATVVGPGGKRIPKERGVTQISMARSKLLRRHEERISAFQTISIIMRAWNAWRTGEHLGRFSHQTTLPVIEK